MLIETCEAEETKIVIHQGIQRLTLAPLLPLTFSNVDKNVKFFPAKTDY